MAKKENIAEWDTRKRARVFAEAYGFYGMAGGWIYREGAKPDIKNTREGILSVKRSRFNGRPICQGWDNFYRLYSRQIEAYINQLEKQQAG